MSAPIRIKICCISTADEARMAVDAGAAALGFVTRMPSGPGVIPEPRIADIVRQVPFGIESFLLTSKKTAEAIIAQHRRTRTSAIQICDQVAAATLRRLQARLPGISLVQVIHVAGEESIGEAIAASRHVDAILLDSGSRSGPVRELGGTGRVHDWNLSRRIRTAVIVPLYLAGGLRPDNVAAAIAAVRPFGVDVCSGVRTEGKLDPAKLRDFVAAASAATA